MDPTNVGAILLLPTLCTAHYCYPLGYSEAISIGADLLLSLEVGRFCRWQDKTRSRQAASFPAARLSRTSLTMKYTV